jgi:hypothetical protein
MRKGPEVSATSYREVWGSEGREGGLERETLFSWHQVGRAWEAEEAQESRERPRPGLNGMGSEEGYGS